ncbi:MAG: ribosome silencing factor [Bacteroidetes bacterium]|nr:ribosome silencing factor [Bacteroidota bacterium]
MKKQIKEAKNALLQSIISGIEEVKGNEIVVMDLSWLPGAICDNFVICHGNSNTQVEAIANKVREFTEKDLNERPWRTEGYGNANWIILDYFNIVVHVFYKETRTFYDIEDLWADADITVIGEEGVEEGLKKANR